jgi:hypothetical protein
MSLLVEKKFAYKHKPTNTWVYMETNIVRKKPLKFQTTLEFLPEFCTGVLYASSEFLEKDLKNSDYGAENFLEFELVQINISYTL